MAAPLPDLWYYRIRHLVRHRRLPRMRDPVTYNDHILALMVSRENAELRTRVSDKVEVRSYVRDALGEAYLPELYGVLDEVGALPRLWAELPPEFVIKASHGADSNWVRIVRDKEGVPLEQVSGLCGEWLGGSHFGAAREYVYREMRPRILFEERLRPASDPEAIPNDYKLFVFNGEVRLIVVDLGRFEQHTRALFTRDWALIPGGLKFPRPKHAVPPPPNLDGLIRAAERLARPFSFIRVDLYDLGDRIVFGEMTNFPGGGNSRFTPRRLDAELGRLFA
ncbi:ATP-grasp fold amidoligase family protein [Allosphingosinicella humi]